MAKPKTVWAEKARYYMEQARLGLDLRPLVLRYEDINLTIFIFDWDGRIHLCGSGAVRATWFLGPEEDMEYHDGSIPAAIINSAIRDAILRPGWVPYGFMSDCLDGMGDRQHTLMVKRFMRNPKGNRKKDNVGVELDREIALLRDSNSADSKGELSDQPPPYSTDMKYTTALVDEMAKAGVSVTIYRSEWSSDWKIGRKTAPGYIEYYEHGASLPETMCNTYVAWKTGRIILPLTEWR